MRAHNSVGISDVWWGKRWNDENSDKASTILAIIQNTVCGLLQFEMGHCIRRVAEQDGGD